MITTDELLKIFSEKLLKTGSFDKAFLKVTWTAYKKGIEDGQSGAVRNSEIVIRDGKLELFSRAENA